MSNSRPGGTIPLSSLDDFLTALYVFVDDFLQARPDPAAGRHSPNRPPAFSDAAVLTRALLQSCLEVAGLQQTDRLMAAHNRAAFPHLCSYARRIARVHARAALLTALRRVTAHLTPEAPAFYRIDAKPLPLCHPVRHRRVRVLREDGARFGKTSQGWFFGCKRPVLRPIAGRMVNLVLTPGHGDDREPALGLAQGGITLGDLSYRGARRAAERAEEADMFLLTRAEAPTHQRLLTHGREAVETTFSQRWYKFLDRIFARSRHGLWHTVQRKVIPYNLRQAGCLPVQ